MSPSIILCNQMVVKAVDRRQRVLLSYCLLHRQQYADTAPLQCYQPSADRDDAKEDKKWKEGLHPPAAPSLLSVPVIGRGNDVCHLIPTRRCAWLWADRRHLIYACWADFHATDNNSTLALMQSQSTRVLV